MPRAAADRDPHPPSATASAARASANLPASGSRSWAGILSDDNPWALAQSFPERTGKIGIGSHPVNERTAGKDGAGAGGILGDLRLQRLDTGKFLLRSDEIDEGDPQMASVEIDLGVEEVRLEPRHEAADRRAQTDIGDAVDRAAGERVVGAVAGNPHGIDAESRMQIVVEPEIRSRKADRPPASVAGGDPSVDLPEPAEERRGLPRLAGFQQLADLGRGIDGRILAANRLDDGDVEASLPTARAPPLRRPPTPAHPPAR